MPKQQPDLRSKPTSVRLTVAEHAQLSEHASAAKISVSEFLRRAGLARVIISRTDSSMINELRRIGGLLKHIHVESKGAYSKETASALSDIQSLIKDLSNRS